MPRPSLGARSVMSVRLPNALHERLEESARALGISMNQRLRLALEQSLTDDSAATPKVPTADVDVRAARGAITGDNPIPTLQRLADQVSSSGAPVVAAVLRVAAARELRHQSEAARASELLFTAGEAARHDNQLELATAVFETCLKDEPGHIQARRSLGLTLYQLSERHDDLDRCRLAAAHLREVSYLDTEARLYEGLARLRVASADNEPTESRVAAEITAHAMSALAHAINVPPIRWRAWQQRLRQAGYEELTRRSGDFSDASGRGAGDER